MINQHFFSDNGLVPNKQQAIICANDSLLYWHVCASLDFNDLTQRSLDQDGRDIADKKFKQISMYEKS